MQQALNKMMILYLSFYDIKNLVCLIGFLVCSCPEMFLAPLVRSHFPMKLDAHPIPPILRRVQDHKALFVHIHSNGSSL